MTVLRVEGAHLHATRAPRSPRCATCRPARASRASSSCSPGVSASGKSTLLRAACGLVPALPRRDVRRPRASPAASTRASTGRPTLAAVAGHAVPGPRDPGRARRPSARSSPSRSRTAGTGRPRWRAGWRRRRSRSGSTACSTARPTSSAAASCSASRSARRSPGARELVLLDEPTSQLDPVAGDELVWLLRRLNEEWGTAVVLAEQRLERCLAAADRVVALDGRPRSPATRRRATSWAGRPTPRPALQTPGARLFSRAGLRPPPAGVKDARATLRAHGLLAPPGPPRAEATPPRRRRPRRPGGRARSTAGAPRWPSATSGTSSRAAAAILRAVDLEVAPRRARRAHGPQRRRQVDAAAPRGRPAGAHARPRARRGPRRPAAPAPRRLPAARARRRRGARRGAARASASTHHADRHPRDLSGGERQRLALAVVLGDDEPAGRGLPRRADARDGPRRQGRSRRPAARRSPATAARCSSPPTTPSSPRRSPTASSCSPTGAPIADGPARRGARGRLVLRDRDRPDPGRRRGRAAPRGGRRAPAPPADHGGDPMSWTLASLRRSCSSRWRPASRGTSARHPSSRVARARRDARRARRARADRVRAAAQRQADHRHRAAQRLRARRRARLRRRRGRRAGVQPRLRRRARGRRGRWRAWGLCGVLGAGARARLGGAASGRWPLAAACGLAGLALRRDPGLLDLDVLQRRTRSTQYLVISARRLPFNVAHAVGNVVFCLAFGPGARARAAALRAALRRWTGGRCRVDDRARAASALAVGRRRPSRRAAGAPGRRASAAATGPPAAPRPRPVAAADRSAAYLLRAQNRDGGCGARAARAPRRSTAPGPRWACRRRPALPGPRAGLPGARRRRACATPATSSARSSRCALRPPARDAGGRDLVAGPARAAPPATARGPAWSTRRAFGIFALRARASAAPATRRCAGRRLHRRQQNRDGGFSLRAARRPPAAIDDTAGALAGAASRPAARGPGPSGARLAFLRRQQHADGGFPLSPRGASNAQTTAFAVAGVRRRPARSGPRPATRRRAAPLAYLRVAACAGDGSVRYSRTSRADARLGRPRRRSPRCPAARSRPPLARPARRAWPDRRAGHGDSVRRFE